METKHVDSNTKVEHVSSGDESMEEDVMETKHVDSNTKPDYLEGKNDVTLEHVVKEVILLDTVTEGSSVDQKEAISQEKPVMPTEKRKAEDQEVVANNEPIKRQRLWNVDDVKPEQATSKLSGSDASKVVHPPARRRSFGRSDSTARGNSPKERMVPPPQKPATTSLRIDRFVRPFTLKAVQELLGKTGSVCSFWMDPIKTHCYVTFSSVEEALATRNAVYNLQWPPNNGSSLVAEFVDPHEVKAKLEPPPPPPAPINPTAATAPSHQSKANQIMPPHAADTSRGLLPTPPALARLPTFNNAPAREMLPPAPKNPEPPVVVTLDDLFRKTQASPRIYYMPVSEEVVSAKLAARGKGKKAA
jgi:apoptotic chromatin condensation inducer in the nucleus